MRLIGVMLVIGAFGIFLSPDEPMAKPKRRGAYVFAILLSIGGGWLAVTGKYPSWGAYGLQFKAIEDANAQQHDLDTPK